MSLEENFITELEEAVDKIEVEKSSENTDEDRDENSDDQNQKEDNQDVLDDKNEKDEPEEGKSEEDISKGGSEEDSSSDDSGLAEKEISDYVLTKAVMAGISLENARNFPSEEALLNVIANVEEMSQELARKQEQNAVSQKSKEQKESILDSLPKLNPDDYEPEVIQMFDALKVVIGKQQEQIESFKNQQQSFIETSQQSNVREVERWFDSQVKSLGGDFSEALGEGGYRTLSPGSSQFAKRDAIAQQMAVMLAGYNATGIEPPPREQVFDAAVRIVLKEEFANRKNKSLADKLKKREGQHISRASGQKGKKSQSPIDETVELINQKFFS